MGLHINIFNSISTLEHLKLTNFTTLPRGNSIVLWDHGFCTDDALLFCSVWNYFVLLPTFFCVGWSSFDFFAPIYFWNFEGYFCGLS